MMDRFGVEIELNSPSPVDREYLEYVSGLLVSAGAKSEVTGWQYSTDNSSWVCKPDASCGMEVCSPVLYRGDILGVKSVMDRLCSEESITADERCSVHLHIDADGALLSGDNSGLCSILAWWIKFEHIFMDFAAPTRKTNRYCKFIGETCLFDHSERVSLHRAFSKLKDKYLTMNTFHMFHRRRNSLEFRILEGTKDFRLVENWINLIFHFVDRCRLSPPPESYVWSDPEDFFKFMEFSEEKSDLRLWFLDRLVKNTSGNRRKGILERYVLLREFGQKA